MPERKYAAGTTVAVEKSEGELKALLKRRGATQLTTIEDTHGNRVAIGCVLQGRVLRFVLPLPDPTAREYQWDRTGKAHDAEVRRRWRCLILAVKAKFTAIETGIVTFEQEFLAHIVLPDGATMGEWAAPQVAAMYAGGRMPPALPAPSEGGAS
jgi:hypothetical protein